ncbi:serine hydrolase [Geodermatophilaceae bacterium NBWT11]|nr:serine hydrolase [Geodermatophilaceae bacterium NBWT11]
MRLRMVAVAATVAGLLFSSLAVVAAPVARAAPAYDLSTQMTVASDFAAGRGQVGISVLDRETGFVSENVWSHTRMRSASIVKLFVAESLLSRARTGQIALSAQDRALMDVMIRSSDDAAMSSLYSRFGGQGMVAEVARKYGLSEIGPPPTPSYWGMYQITAHDIMAFYRGMLAGGLVPEDRDHLVGLMRSATRNGTDGFDQFFGIPQAMPAESRGVKQGWMCCQEGQRRLHTSGVLGADNRFVVVVLSQVGSGTSYATAGQTLTGVVERLFPGGRVPPPASSRNPVGSLDEVSEVSSGVFRLRGWVFDPDVPQDPVRVDTYVDGVGASSRYAGDPRPDVGAAYPGVGSGHGWSIDVPVASGTHQVCSYWINVGAGTANTVVCATVTAAIDPIGHLDSATVTGMRTVAVAGWTADPDRPTTPTEAHVYVAGTGTALSAGGARADVARVFPRLGAGHGFSGTALSGGGGAASVCAFGINVAGSRGDNSVLGCVAVVLPQNVVGSLDTVSARGGRVSVTGWSVDSAAAAGVTRVDLYADDVAVGSVQAGLARPDLSSHFSDTGQTHGFAAEFAVSPGLHTVCAYGIPITAQSTYLQLGCQAVVV